MTKTAKVNVRPILDFVLIKPSSVEEKTAGGLWLPDVAKELPWRGKVIAVGPGRVLDNGTRVTIDIEKGSEVVYSKYAGNEVRIDGEEYRILRESEIFGVIEDADE